MGIENLEEINQQLDVELVLREIGYEKSNPLDTGQEIRDYCPVHQGGRQRSLCINKVTKLCFCQSCGFKGDVIELFRQARSIKLPDAVRTLAPIAGVEIRYSGATKTNMAPEKRTPQEVLASSKPGGEHSYLKDKKVEHCEGLLYGKDERGNPAVIVPFYTVNGDLQTVQFVHKRGKFFLGGYSYNGSFFSTSKFSNGDTVYLAEGIATALTIWMAFEKRVPVISFGSANNMLHAVEAIRSRYPNLKLVLCLDHNKAATDQAKHLTDINNCSYRLPSFDGMVSSDKSKELADFNDLTSKCNQPLSVVRIQLMAEYNLNDSVKGESKTIAPATTPDVAESPDTLISKYQEEVLSYLFKRSLEKILQDGLTTASIPVYLFTNLYRLVMEGIIKTWQQELPVTSTQISINVDNDSTQFHSILRRIESSPCIEGKQVVERISYLRQYYAQSSFDNLITKTQSSNMTVNEKAEVIRKGIDELQGESAIIFPQSYHLHQIVDNLKNPKFTPLKTGIVSLDRLIGGGFNKTELGMLAGGAGAGKTAFALQVADSIAKNEGIVIYISIEIGINKLTERSLKRLSYPSRDFDLCISEYQSFSNNIYLIKGRHGMHVSEIRGMALSVMKQRKAETILVVIDPFQRLSCGNERADYSNETIKIGILCSQIKEMAESLNIPILALCDTVKNHKDNASGEGAIRGSYMADHTADYVMMLKTSMNPFEAIYGEKAEERKQELEKENPLYGKINEALGSGTFTDKMGCYTLSSSWDKYAGLVTSKVRDGAKFSPLFVYRPAYHLFEDTMLWEKVLNDDITRRFRSQDQAKPPR